MLGDTPRRFRGTLRHVAPERVTATTELYALGLVPFESLTLRRPFERVDDCWLSLTAAADIASLGYPGAR
jgi:hypothetical protein